MKPKTKDRILACTMTATLLLVLWLAAAWMEVRSHLPRLGQLSLTESFESAVSSPPSSVQAAVNTEEPVPRRRPPPIPELTSSEPSIPPPLHRVHSSVLQPLKRSSQLMPGRTNTETGSASVTARIRTNPSPLTSRRSPSSELRKNRAPLATTVVAGRQNPSAKPLAAEHGPAKSGTRVLKAEEAKLMIQWMRMTESDLPPGIKHHVGYQPGNLSSVARLEYEGEIWEIYLVARMPSEELHVVIVRGDATYYVVDPGFKRDGRRFRVGTARRNGDVITGITSEERAASSHDAALHYDVFLVWWDELRLTLQ